MQVMVLKILEQQAPVALKRKLATNTLKEVVVSTIKISDKGTANNQVLFTLTLQVQTRE